MDHLDEAACYALFDNPPGALFDFVAWLGEVQGLSRGSVVLDMGCGTGRLLLPMAALGWRVTGREPHGGYVERARHVTDGHTDVGVVRGGWNDLSERSEYDAVLAVNGPFAYLLDTPSREDALSRTRDALRPGGVLLLDVPNLPWILRHYAPPKELVAALPDGRLVHRRSRHEIDWHEGVLTHTDEFELDGRIAATTIHRFAILAVPAILDLVQRAGFVDAATFPSYESRARARIDGARVIVTARAAPT